MEKILGKYSAQIYALMRIVVGFMFMLHGSQKLLGFPPSNRPGGGGMTPLIAAAGGIELICGLLIMIGFLAGWAAFLASGTMAVAYFMVHQPGGILPIQNGGEPAALYCWVLLYIASQGSGAWSVDALRNKGSA
jgi:putative oxidoreductase